MLLPPTPPQTLCSEKKEGGHPLEFPEMISHASMFLGGAEYMDNCGMAKDTAVVARREADRASMEDA